MEKFILDLSIVLAVSAFLAVLAIFIKQPIIIAYIFSGIIIGTTGGIDVKFMEAISTLGITLLLFLAGLCLHPQKLVELFKKTSLITIANCIGSFIIAFAFAFIVKFSLIDSLCIGLALMFSSTILVIKLLPTTRLHQERMGAICISVLILQDLIAVAVLALIRCINAEGSIAYNYGILGAKLIVFVAVLMLFERYILRKIIMRTDRIHEALFVIGLAWCFGVAAISNQLGLFYEIGAFFAGVVLASNKISFFITEKLKPIRDFFLVLFFFSLGAQLDLLVVKNIFLPSLTLAVIFIAVKPLLFGKLFLFGGESKKFADELGIRLGQLSEFSMLIAIFAFQAGVISERASQFIELVTILTFIASGYIVVFKYPTPIGTSEKLIRD